MLEIWCDSLSISSSNLCRYLRYREIIHLFLNDDVGLCVLFMSYGVAALSPFKVPLQLLWSEGNNSNTLWKFWHYSVQDTVKRKIKMDRNRPTPECEFARRLCNRKSCGGTSLCKQGHWYSAAEGEIGQYCRQSIVPGAVIPVPVDRRTKPRCKM